LHLSFLGCPPDPIALPILEIAIYVSEDIRSLGKGFLTIGGIKHQWLVSGNKIEAVIHSGTNSWYDVSTSGAKALQGLKR